MHTVALMATQIDIKAIRRRLGLTLGEMGERLGGVHQTTVGRWESGKTKPRGPALKVLRQLEALAAVSPPGTGEGGQ